MAVSASYSSTLTVQESFASQTDAIPDSSKVTHSAFNTNVGLSGSTNPSTTKVVSGTYTFSGTTGSLDLTSLTGTNGVSVDTTGLRVIAFKFLVPSTEAAVTIGDTTTPSDETYSLFNMSGGRISLEPGQEVAMYCAGAGDVVSSDAPTIPLAGTNEKDLQYILLFGSYSASS